MNLISIAPLWLVAIVAGILAIAAIQDALWFRISNAFPLTVLVGAIAAAATNDLPWELWQNVLVFLAILALGTMAFAAGIMGGGDVKLFAAVGLWLDFQSALWLVTLVFLSGGALALIYIAARSFPGSRRRDGRRVPYGIAIGAGALALIVLDVRFSKPRDPYSMPIKILPHKT